MSSEAASFCLGVQQGGLPCTPNRGRVLPSKRSTSPLNYLFQQELRHFNDQVRRDCEILILEGEYIEPFRYAFAVRKSNAATTGLFRFSHVAISFCAKKAETYFLGDGRTYERQKGELLHPEQGRT